MTALRLMTGMKLKVTELEIALWAVAALGSMLVGYRTCRLPPRARFVAG